MTLVQVVIVLEWLFTTIGAAAFLLAYGRPSKYQDKVMSWHLVSVTAVAGLESFGLLLMAVTGLGPLAAVYGAGAGVVYWRLWLLLRSRRKAKSAIEP